MMSYFIWCFLLTFLGVFSEKRSIDQDSCVLLFENIRVHDLEKDVSLFVNGVQNASLIVKWKIDNGDITAMWRMKTYTKIFMDANRNIWIANINKTYEGTYHIQPCSESCKVELIILGINNDITTPRIQKNDTEDKSLLSSEICDLNRAVFWMVIVGIVLVVLLLVVIVLIGILIRTIWRKKGTNHVLEEEKDPATIQNKSEKETIPLLSFTRTQPSKVADSDGSDGNRLTFSLKWRFSGRTHNDKDEPWLLDLVLNPDQDIIVTDGLNKELKKFSLNGQLKDKLSFDFRPDCLALTDGYHVTVTFPQETVLRVVDTKDALSVVSTIQFRSQCAGISTMKDGRLIIGNRESRSVLVCSKDGNIQQEIKNGSSGETLFKKPSYVGVVDNRTIYVSDDRTEEFSVISIKDDSTFDIKKRKLTDPRTSCVVGDMLLVAASNIRVFTLEGHEKTEILLDGVHHARGLAFSEDKKLLAITHKSDGDETISVYQVTKQ